jgi:mannitol-1-phosphate 5-dehydrogenase
MLQQQKGAEMSCVIFGAGKIARGFIGHLLFLSKIPYIYVEKSDALADLINARGKYYVNILGNSEKSCTVTGARCLKYSEEAQIIDAIAHADAVFNAVGGKNLGDLIPFYAKGIEKRAELGIDDPINFVTCENWKKPADILKDGVYAAIRPDLRAYLESHAGFTEAVILRSGIDATEEQKEKDPLWVNVQDYWYLHVDESRLAGKLPDIVGLHLIPEFGGFLERKFYTYNAANGTASFVGALFGYKVLSEAASDERIVRILEGVYKETSGALCKKYGFDEKEQFEFTRGSLHKLQNKVIVDTIERNARDPIRKLGPDDRLVGSARLAESYGICPENLATGIAAAIFYESDNENDPSLAELRTLRKNKGVRYIIRNICKVDPDGDLGRIIQQKVQMLADQGYVPKDYKA